VIMKSACCLLGHRACSPLKVGPRFVGTYSLYLQGGRIRQARDQPESELCTLSAFTMVYCLAYSWTLKMEAICSSETSVGFQRTTQLYVPEDSALQVYMPF
jgi:hypothetical protein